MFQKSLKSIALVFRYAPGLTLLKLLQIGVSAVLAPLSIYFTQRVIDAVTVLMAAGGEYARLYGEQAQWYTA